MVSDLQNQFPIKDLVSGWTPHLWQNVHSIEEETLEWVKRKCWGNSSLREHFLSHLIYQKVPCCPGALGCHWDSVVLIVSHRENRSPPCPLSLQSSSVTTFSTSSNSRGLETQTLASTNTYTQYTAAYEKNPCSAIKKTQVQVLVLPFPAPT